MISEQSVRDALHGVRDPYIDKPIDELGVLRRFEVRRSTIHVEVALTLPSTDLRDAIRDRVTGALEVLSGVKRVEVEFDIMPESQRSELVSRLRAQIPFTRADGRATVIGVSSGKGGVGKSTVTANVAAAMQTLGHRVGVLDADVYGYSIPRILGVGGRRPVTFSGIILPLDRNGVKVFSFGAVVDHEEQPAMYRGPMLAKVLEQFLSDVYWSDELEYLLIDLPPGTGDVTLSLAQMISGLATVVVTTPQRVAQKVAARAASVTDKLNVKLLGVVENMTGSVFGEGGGRALAESYDVPLLAQIPLDAALREASDDGEPLVWSHPEHEIARTFTALAGELLKYRPRRRLPVMQVGGR